MTMQVVAEDKSLVVREGSLDRLRVPSGILSGAGATYDGGDGIAWQVQDFGGQGKLIVGTVVHGARNMAEFARKPPTPPQRAAQPAGPKPSSKKSAKKGGVAAALPPPPGLGGAFAVPVAAAQAEDTEYLDDSPLPPAPMSARPVAAVAPVPKASTAPAPVAAAAKGGPKKSAKKGAVAYQIPGAATGFGAQFAE